jgi:hypothetical protein
MVKMRTGVLQQSYQRIFIETVTVFSLRAKSSDRLRFISLEDLIENSIAYLTRTVSVSGFSMYKVTTTMQENNGFQIELIDKKDL